VRALVDWAYVTRSPGAHALRRPPFDRSELPEIVGTALVFHYVNGMVSVFLGDSPLPSSVRWMGPVASRMATAAFARAVRRVGEPGASLAHLPERPLPDDLAWAAPAPHVAGALARFSATVEEKGIATVPESVRELVRDEVRRWDGTDPGVGRGWLDRAVRRVPGPDRKCARLLLLTAFAPYQVTDADVDDFRERRPEERRLVGALAWASLLAARRTTSWMVPG